MWYFILYAILAVWVLIDAKKRINHIIWWPLATFILGPLVLPVYLAKRNLKEGEVREGGTGWNISKNFALLWTITIAVGSITALVRVSNITKNITSEAEQTGMAIGITIGFGMIFILWFIVIVSALVLGLFLKKSSIVEKGPTGPLAQATSGRE